MPSKSEPIESSLFKKPAEVILSKDKEDIVTTPAEAPAINPILAGKNFANNPFLNPSAKAFSF